MKLHLTAADRHFTVTGHAPGRIDINGRRHQRSLLFMPDRVGADCRAACSTSARPIGYARCRTRFELPLYSWYPGFVKRKYEHLAVTTRPEVVNHAKYPAVNWFSFYSLSRYLGQRGFRCLDRFDLIDTANRSTLERAVTAMTKALPPLPLAGHVLPPGTVIFAFKQS